MKKPAILIWILFWQFCTAVQAQNPIQYPKLVVGIVVDQMRYDYLKRFSPLFGNDGFKRLIDDGSNFTFTHYNYVPTYTAPGHTSIYTGTTPYFHGIIANDWYDRIAEKKIYCTFDPSVNTVGAPDKNGQESPKRLLATTITDQLKLATNGQSRVIAVSLKDRASIFPGGHMADAAYWYDKKTGNFISSTFYMNQLPGWVDDFNKKKLALKYISGSWQLSFPPEKYTNTLPDEQPFEVDRFNEEKTTFPHSFKNVPGNKKSEKIVYTPYGNQILFDYIKTLIKSEHLGKNKVTDFLAVSFSSTDYIGHSYGPNSVEVEDTYIKLDAIIADLLKDLDQQAGTGNYLLFLTADHGVADAPSFLKTRNITVGRVDTLEIQDALKSFVQKTFGTSALIENISNKQVFLNHDVIQKSQLDEAGVEEACAAFLRKNFPSISQIYTRDDLEELTAFRTCPNLLLNGFNPVRSGDILFELQPGYLYGTGIDPTTHGSAYNYDTHVPLIFYGWHIPQQTVNSPVYIVDIAPTIASLLGIQEPSASIGVPLIE